MAGFHTKTFSKHDHYDTPKYAWENIKQYIPRDKVIWEPFMGNGQSARFLRELGFDNVIHDDDDFFKSDKGEIIVTNCPFSQSKAVMNRLKELGKPFIMILPASKICTSYVRNNFMNQGLQIIIPRKRIHFDKKVNGETPKDYKSSCNFDCFYYCWKINLPNDIIWLE